jgi:hypothetical protein
MAGTAVEESKEDFKVLGYLPEVQSGEHLSGVCSFDEKIRKVQPWAKSSTGFCCNCKEATRNIFSRNGECVTCNPSKAIYRYVCKYLLLKMSSHDSRYLGTTLYP